MYRMKQASEPGSTRLLYQVSSRERLIHTFEVAYEVKNVKSKATLESVEPTPSIYSIRLLEMMNTAVEIAESIEERANNEQNLTDRPDLKADRDRKDSQKGLTGPEGAR